MTRITFQDGKVVLRDGKIGTEQACCCKKCEGPCDDNEDCAPGCRCLDGECVPEPPPCSGPCDEENPCPEGCCCCDGECVEFTEFSCPQPSAFIDGVWIGGSGWVLPFGYWPILPAFEDFMPIDIGEGCGDNIPPTGTGDLYMGGGGFPPESELGVSSPSFSRCGPWTIYFTVAPKVDFGNYIGDRGARVYFRTVWKGCSINPETGRISLTLVSSAIEAFFVSGICGVDNDEAFDPSVDWASLNGRIEIGCGPCGTPCPNVDPEALDQTQYYSCNQGCECVDEECVPEENPLP